MVNTLDSVETPALLIDETRTLENIRRFQAHCTTNGLQLRPHIKTHKTIRFAEAQLAAGATGINCQKIGEAEVMADAGLDDILITFNVLGEAKLDRLRSLAERVKLRVVADSQYVVNGLSEKFSSASNPLSVLVECDTGGARCGVQTPAEAVDLAKRIDRSTGLDFEGLLTYPAPGGQLDVISYMTEAKALLEAAGLSCSTISSGGSPDMWQAQSAGVITEYRIGTYIFNDRSLVARNVCSWDQCAGTILATIVSMPTPERAVIDAGSKALTSDLLGLDGHGYVVGYPDVRIIGLSEEHGVLEISDASGLSIGDRIRIVPNHICVVVNMFDKAWLVTEQDQLCELNIDARGLLV